MFDIISKPPHVCFAILAPEPTSKISVHHIYTTYYFLVSPKQNVTCKTRVNPISRKFRSTVCSDYRPLIFRTGL